MVINSLMTLSTNTYDLRNESYPSVIFVTQDLIILNKSYNETQNEAFLP